MKHWDETDVADCKPIRLSRADRKRLRAMFAHVPEHRRRREPTHPGSIIGVALAFATLAALAWALAPAGPVSPKILP
ncbi:hypothetical protein [Sphingomonas alba]|uniref:Uncharacterized protein n=1 Tax=Sphingomonas alba TaxID=2908208 RepID=A0ABT0RMZ2_9SPHN|nr:hypothetical protein [Sphingomonas alba]MCL6684024.1 hypothetical protein [Sphingomonas alba]